MNLYQVTGHGGYSVGMALIAANSSDEAIALARTIDTYPWYIQYNAICELVGCSAEGEPRVVTHFEHGE